MNREECEYFWIKGSEGWDFAAYSRERNMMWVADFEAGGFQPGPSDFAHPIPLPSPLEDK